MTEEVFFIRCDAAETDESLGGKLERVLKARDLLGFIQPRDMVAIKTHFGEADTDGYVRPLFLRLLAERIRRVPALPFMTETSTLYSGHRSNAIAHIAQAHAHGFGFETTRMPIVMADGLFGDEEVEVEIPGRIFPRVKIAALLAKIQALVAVSHFTGHIQTGFGATLKNLGMGLASRRGKLNQHSTAKPTVKKKKCTGCGVCQAWCPVQAISLASPASPASPVAAVVAVIDHSICIGCGQCLAVCRFDAIGYNWGASQEQLQKKMVEHALGVSRILKGRMLCLNFLTRISRDCDCMGPTRVILNDIGVLIGSDPVAVDAAALDLVEERLSAKGLRLPAQEFCRIQLEYAVQIGLGNAAYRLVDIS